MPAADVPVSYRPKTIAQQRGVNLTAEMALTEDITTYNDMVQIRKMVMSYALIRLIRQYTHIIIRI